MAGVALYIVSSLNEWKLDGHGWISGYNVSAILWTLALSMAVVEKFYPPLIVGSRVRYETKTPVSSG